MAIVQERAFRSPRVAAPRVVVPALAIIASVVLLWLPLGTFDVAARETVVWGTSLTLIGLAVVSFITTRRRGVSAWLDPVFLMTGYFGFKYGFGVLVLNYWSVFSWLETPEIGTVFERWGIWDYLPMTCHLFLVAGLGLYLGTALPPGRLGERLPALRWRINEKRFRLNLYIYTPIALVVFVFARGFLPLVIRDTLLLFGWLSWVIMIIAGYRLFSSDAEDRMAWLGLIGIIWAAHVALGLEMGTRGAFVYPVLLVGLGYLMARGRLPLVFTTVALAALLIAVIPWLSYYKIQPAEMGISARFEAASEEYAKAGIRGAIERGVEALIGRSVGVTGMAPVFVQYYPSLYAFESGQTFAIEATHLIPRMIWPDKPNMSEQLNAYTRRTGMIQEDDDATSAVFDAVTEYYINFGVWGVFVLCLIHGYYYRILHEWLVVRSAMMIGPPIFLVLMFINFDFFGVTLAIVSHTRQIPVWAAILWGLSRDSRAKSAGSS